MSKPNPAANYFADVSGVAIEAHKNPEESGVVPIGIDVISDPERSEEIYQQLLNRFGENIELLNFSTVTAAHSKEASKGKALSLMAEELAVPQEQVVAVGDSVNDVSMLQWAGLGASPMHCDDHAREVTDKILPGDGVDGVAVLLEDLAP